MTSVSQSLSRIERELAAIWQPDGGGNVKPRAMTLNLIAVHGQKDGAAFVECVDDVAARLGARTFLVDVDPRLEPWALEGDVSAVCRLEPNATSEAVCAEHVSLSFGAMVAKRAASVLDALVESSLPTLLLAGPGAHWAAIEALVPDCQRVIIDSAELGLERAATLAERAEARLDDLAFVRIRRWREMAARMFDDAELRPALASIRALELRHAHRPDHGGASMEAELWVGWLGARLEYRIEGSRILNREGREVTVQIVGEDQPEVTPGCLSAVKIESVLAGEPFVGRVLRDKDGQHLAWELEAACTHPPARRFAIPRRNDSELIERTIRDMRGDLLLRESLAFARRWRASR